MRLGYALSSATLLVLLAVPAYAQTTTQSGFALNRFDPSERGSDWFALESLDLRGHNRWAVGVVGDWAYKPLVLYDSAGDERTAIVKHQAFAHVGASAILWDRVRFALSAPILAYQDGEEGRSGNTIYPTKTGGGIGDLRLGADVRLLGKYGSAFTMAAGLQLWLPTGSRDAYTSDGTVRVQPRVTAAGDVGPFTYAARVGFNIRPQTDEVGGSPMGSELSFGAAAGLRLADRRLTIGPELYGSTVVTDSDALFKKRTTPFEVIFGAHYQFADNWRLGAGVGPGLTRGFGSPQVRGLLSLEFFPVYKEAVPPPPDRDRDGIVDTADACPDVAGPPNQDPAKNGCPPPPDRDGDGVIDAEDACPDVAGVASQDPKTNGCPPPPPDRDGDGVLDKDDACIDVAGVPTQDPKTNGCPPPTDKDGDGILDPEDACPDQPGPKDVDPKKNGCPAARIEQGQIKILQQVKFETAKAVIRPESDSILEAVSKILKEHPEVKALSVEGHTDNRGNAALNKVLSQNRAKAVVTWLVKHGIEKGRLTSAGFGQERPIDTNDTDEGRQNNRRVEFHIRDGAGGAVKDQAPTPGTKPQAAPKAAPKAAAPTTKAPATKAPAKAPTKAAATPAKKK